MMSAHVDPDNEHVLDDVSIESDLLQQSDPVIEDVVIEDVDVVLLEDEPLAKEAESALLPTADDETLVDREGERPEVASITHEPTHLHDAPLSESDIPRETADSPVEDIYETDPEDAGGEIPADDESVAAAGDALSQTDASIGVTDEATPDDEAVAVADTPSIQFPVAAEEVSDKDPVDENAGLCEAATAAASDDAAAETAEPESEPQPDEAAVDTEEAPAASLASETPAPPAAKSSPTEDKLRLCEQSLGYTFFDKKLIKNALTHSSSTSDKRLDNERLEFFGDAVLDLIIREYLYHNYPNHQEGDLTEAKSAVVCRASLAKASKRMELKSFLFLGRGIGKKRAVPDSLLADAYEAIVAAIYLDGGYQPARNFVLMTLKDEIPGAMQAANSTNYKSNLQKYLQQQKRPLPIYKVQGSTGPEHSRVFEVAAVIEGEEMGRGSGSSKKAAEQEAARIALEKFELDSE